MIIRVDYNNYKDNLEWFYLTCEIGSRILGTIILLSSFVSLQLLCISCYYLFHGSIKITLTVLNCNITNLSNLFEQQQIPVDV